MNTQILLSQLCQAWKNDLPKDSLLLYKEISNEYIAQRDFEKLGKLILLAKD